MGYQSSDKGDNIVDELWKICSELDPEWIYNYETWLKLAARVWFRFQFLTVIAYLMYSFDYPTGEINLI